MKLFRLLGNLNLAIILLLLIAFFSIIGTILEQNQPSDFYQLNYPINFPFFNWKILLFFGLDHIYSSWWFFFLLVFFGSSLISCTFVRQIPILKVGQRWFFYKDLKQFQRFSFTKTFSPSKYYSLIFDLNQVNYSILQQGKRVYANKGLLGRVSPIIVHFSLLLILMGSLIGSVFGFVDQELIPKGEVFHFQNTIENGVFSYVPQDVVVRINNFWFKYKVNENRVDQFYSDISILNSFGDELSTKVIYVNQPLVYKQLTLYQTDWSISALRLKINNSIQLPFKNVLLPNGNKVWFTTCRIGLNSDSIFSFTFQNLDNELSYYNSDGILLGQVKIGDTFSLNNTQVEFFDLVDSTGLQIKSDPGIIFVYIGFTLLIISIFISYISHSQVWVLKTFSNIYITGITNRSQVFFERELIDLLDK